MTTNDDDTTMAPTEIVCSRCGHIALLTSELKSRMVGVEQPIYKMVCTACGQRDAIYSRWPLYGIFSLTSPAELVEEQGQYSPAQAKVAVVGRQAVAYDRVFAKIEDATAFRAKSVAISEAPVRLVRQEAGFKVSYSSPDGQPISSFRRGVRYREDEKNFLIEAYLSWAPPSALAESVDRSEDTVSHWLAQHGYRVVPRDPHFARDGFPDDYALDMCNQIAEGFVYELDELVKVGIIPSLPDPVPGVCGPGYYPLGVLDETQLTGLLEFTIQRNAFDAASDLCLRMGRPGQGYVYARQAKDMPRALVALRAMKSDHPMLRAVHRVTEDAMRAHVIARLPTLMRGWAPEVAERCRDYQLRLCQPNASTEIAALLRPVLTPEAESPRDLVEFLRVLDGKRIVIGDMQGESNKFSAWVGADMARSSVGRCSGDHGGAATMESERYIAACESYLNGWEPDIEGLLSSLVAWLSFDRQAAEFVRLNQEGYLPVLVEHNVLPWAIPAPAGPACDTGG